MVPHRLKLQNFLSYGVNAPELDFSAFKVACLSGANGQGKSALLEAMTWALWGEARKASSSRNAAGDLLRTGANRMVVDFTFAIEGLLYRVVRAFNRSESGKTTRSELELYVQDESGAWRTLTEASQSQTDKRLAALLGVGYDTFVNASFLMQGRSDEFTRRTPSSRKDVLASILDLSRYEELEAAAKDQLAGVSQRLRTLEIQRLTLEDSIQAEADIEARVDAAVLQGKELKLSLEASQVGLQAAQKTLAKAEQDVLAIHTWKEAEQSSQSQVQSLEAELKALEERVVRDSSLVAQKDLILKNAKLHEELGVERERLLRLSAIHNSLHYQWEANERRMSERKATLDTQRTRLQERLIALEHQVDRLQERVHAGAGWSARREEARRDAAPLEDLREAERAHMERERLRQELETQLREARQALQFRLDSLRAEDKRLREALQQAHVDTGEHTLVRQDVDRLEACEKELERIREEGIQAGKVVDVLTQNLVQVAHDRERVNAQRAVVHHPESSRCPTCGTALTPDHRRTVMGELDEQLREFDHREAEFRRRERVAQSRVEQLREDFTRIREERTTLAEAPSRLATLEERLQQRTHLQSQREALKAEGLALKVRLETVPFDAPLEARLAELASESSKASFDVQALRRAESAAEREKDLHAHVLAWEEDVRQLRDSREALARQKTMLEQHVQAVDTDADLARGLEQRREHSRNIEALGFDATYLNSVTKQLEQLHDAPVRVRDVLHAQDLLANAAASKAQLEDGLVRLQNTLKDLSLKLATEPVLRERELQARREGEEASALVRAAQRAHSEHQQTLGALLERRDRFREENAKRAEVEQSMQATRKKESLYTHLRQAFGKNGIPALIIEHTVPEIEYRANELLDQLSQGKLHLRLETTREKKDGKEADTLDVIVLDDTGSKRPYETFSGGEAFRINFALRLALSHILAERAGIRIRTLVIDEGFGTQDPEGISQLIEAIRTVQDSFDKILVISHLDEIKEAFPVRIEVRKEPVLGSTFDVIGVE